MCGILGSKRSVAGLLVMPNTFDIAMALGAVNRLGEGLLLWLAEKILLPIANSTVGSLRRAAPAWLRRMRTAVRVKRLELEVSAGELQILRFLSGRQHDYEHIAQALSGALEDEQLLLAVTKLQVLGLLSKPRLQQPPHPSALFTVAGDADALLRAKTPKARRVRPNRRDIPEAIERRQRAAEAAAWLTKHEAQTNNADYIPGESIAERDRLRDQMREDQAWLTAHGL